MNNIKFEIEYSPHCLIVNQILLDLFNNHLLFDELCELDTYSDRFDWKIFNMELLITYY
jgi:hypothetical protein